MNKHGKASTVNIFHGPVLVIKKKKRSKVPKKEAFNMEMPGSLQCVLNLNLQSGSYFFYYYFILFFFFRIRSSPRQVKKMQA